MCKKTHGNYIRGTYVIVGNREKAEYSGKRAWGTQKALYTCTRAYCNLRYVPKDDASHLWIYVPIQNNRYIETCDVNIGGSGVYEN